VNIGGLEIDSLDLATRLAGGNRIRTIFDVGAYTGDTVTQLRRAVNEAKIYAFDADPRSAKALSKRFACDPSVFVYDKAVMNESGWTEFYLNEYSATSSILPRPRNARQYYPTFASKVDRIRVAAVRLDEFAADLQIDEIDLLKIDIQGGEMRAFQGAAGLLREGRINVIHTEVYFIPHYEGSPMAWDQALFLSERGYSMFGLYNEVWAANGQMRFADAIFVSPRIRAEVIDAATEES
jgi:FkbM family methyltransferase